MKQVFSIILKVIGWILVIIGCLSFFAHIFWLLIIGYSPYGSFFGTVLTFIIGYAIRHLGYRIGNNNNTQSTDISTNKPTIEELPITESHIDVINQSTPKTPKKRKPIKWKKIFVTIGLAGIFGYCVGCIDEGDSLTAWMIITYIPIFIILYVYYVRLIWKHGHKVTKEQLLLLPLLQKISTFRDYSGDIEDRKRLFSTSFYGIVLSVLCTAIVSTMYYDMRHGIRDYYGICYMLLSLPLVIWIIGISIAAFQNWLSISITVTKQPTDDKAK